VAATRLKIYNGALMRCTERALASLTEEREPRRLLDGVWQDNGVRYCLEQAQWKFAKRSAHFTPSQNVTTSFGYRWGYAKPTDWVSTMAVCQDEYFRVPLLQYRDEASYWFADLEDIYISYVSDDENYGMDLSKWTDTFTDYVEAYFASKIIWKLPGGLERVDAVNKSMREALKVAKNKDAMADPTKIPPPGAWPMARVGRRGFGGPMGDGGNPGSLTG